MGKKKNQKLEVQGAEIRFFVQKEEDYISITDIAKKVGNEQVLYNWMRNRNTIEYLGTWETLYNPDFNTSEFDRFRMAAGLNSFTMSPKKWRDSTKAIGIVSKAGRYGGGTYAHKDIALEFCSWIDPVFKLYLIKEFQRLKTEESDQKSLDWNIRRTIAKVNYHIHADAVKEFLIPPRIQNTKHAGYVYASEADMLNQALFGMTAKTWKIQSPKLNGNLRDNATAEQLVVLANLESINAEFIRLGLDQDERLERLNEIAIYQMQLLVQISTLKQLKPENKKLLKPKKS